MHLKSKTMSFLGSFFRSFKESKSVSPFLRTTVNRQVAVSITPFIPSRPFTLTFFTAALRGYSFTLLVLSNKEENTFSFAFNTDRSGFGVPPSFGCFFIQLNPNHPAVNKTKNRAKDTIVLTR